MILEFLILKNNFFLGQTNARCELYFDEVMRYRSSWIGRSFKFI